jgi:UDP-glucuronate 4-epimerase
MPFEETERTATPLTLYAATKGWTELMGHAYANLFSIPMTFSRFFTAYGPWGRPDMAYFKFLKAMLDDEPIEVFNNGDMARDFTYNDDLVEAIVRLVIAVPGAATPVAGDSLSAAAPFRIVNIGQGKPVHLLDFIGAIENHLGRAAKKNFLPMQPGDVQATEASSELLEGLTGYSPSAPVSVGVPQFVDCYLSRHCT